LDHRGKEQGTKVKSTGHLSRESFQLQEERLPKIFIYTDLIQGKRSHLVTLEGHLVHILKAVTQSTLLNQT
jgi:hypothetical protein